MSPSASCSRSVRRSGRPRPRPISPGSGSSSLRFPPALTPSVKLTVQQSVSRTNVRGEPIPPGYLTITIRRERASGTTEESRQIGTVFGKGSGGGSATGGIDPQEWVRKSHGETMLRDGSLEFIDRQSGPADYWSERRETWSLESDGHLRIEVVSEAKDRPRQMTLSLYKRNSK